MIALDNCCYIHHFFTWNGVSLMRRCMDFVSRVSLLAALSTMGLCLSSRTALADSYDYRNVNGVNWNSTIKSQFGGTCWDFSSCGTLEAKYMLTRNDPNYVPNVSEQQVCWETNPDMGSAANGGWGTIGLELFHQSRRGLGSRVPVRRIRRIGTHPVLAILGLWRPAGKTACGRASPTRTTSRTVTTVRRRRRPR